MKRILFACAGIFMLAFFSCKKDRTCECTTIKTTTTTGGGQNSTYVDGPQKTTIVYKGEKKSDLKKACGNVRLTETSYSSASSTVVYNTITDTKCELK